jgi:hypothetical protein
MTFNTGNNVPSTDPRDLYDNAENFDKLLNGGDPFYADRKGVLRQSYAGMENDFDTAQSGRENTFMLSQADKESRFQAFLVSSGYVNKGDYAANVVLEERNEYVFVSASTTGTTAGLYFPSGSAAVPLTLTGSWATDLPNLVLREEDALRQEITTGALLDADMSNRGLVTIQKVTELADVPTGRSLAVHLLSYYGDLAVYDTKNAASPIAAPMGGAPVGGSMLVWDASLPRSAHDGGMVFSPTVPFDGNSANLADYLNGVGETDSAALGCWVRVLADGVVYVTYYGARPVLGFDSTRAFNGATEAFKAYGANPDDTIENESPRKRVIGVPASADPFEIHGTVYVRKGQHLRGLGDGPCRVVIPVISSSIPTFKLAYGFVNGVEVVDDGGLPPSISNLCTEGGHTLAPVVEATGVAGVSMYKMFITAAPKGFKGAGGDMVLNSCTFDDCTLPVEMTGSRNVLSDCHFFHPSANAVRVLSGSYDWLIRDCTFAYCEQQDILIQGDAGTVRGLSIADCNFIENGQYAGKTTHIGINMSDAEVLINDCNFSNSKSWAIADLGVNTGNVVRVRDCHFTGKKVHPLYIQSSTTRGIRVGGGDWLIQGCDFRDMFDFPIQINCPNTADHVRVIGNTWTNNTFTGALVTITSMNAAARLLLSDNEGDQAMPLIASGNFSGVRLSGNRRWLGAEQAASSRKYFRIPTFGVFVGSVRVTANPIPGGSALYRKAALFAVSRGTDYISSAIQDYVQSSSLHNPTVGTAGALAVQFDLDSVGGGAQLTPSQVGRGVVVSVPDTYANFEVEVA